MLFKVIEYSDKGQSLFVSLSVDDIGIRRHVEMTKGGIVVGYQDLGIEVDLGGGPTGKLATHVMTLMLTALNDSWKIPIGHFIITEKFTGKGKINI